MADRSVSGQLRDQRAVVGRQGQADGGGRRCANAALGCGRATSSATVGLPLPADDRPLIAKLTTYAPIRHRALLSMDRMLAEMRAEPFETNVQALRRILSDYAFRAGQYDSESAFRFATG